jgi:hypothetical protein
MASEIVRLGRAAWERLKKGRASWSDWVLVGLALQEGRAIAMRNAGVSSPIGGAILPLSPTGSSATGST